MNTDRETHMPDLFLIFNHKFTSLQEKDARRSLNVARIVKLPADLKELWCSIPPEIPQLATYLQPIQKWLQISAERSDFVLIQGDFGACYLMVKFAFDLGLVPIYSTTGRDAVEKHASDGEVVLTHRFRHVIFRRYGV
jgi:hypothetical protein